MRVISIGVKLWIGMILIDWYNNSSINLGVSLGCAEVVVPEDGAPPSSRCIPQKTLIS